MIPLSCTSSTVADKPSYQDMFISTSPESNASVFHRSIVFHFPNLTRIACANLELLVPGLLGRFKSRFCVVSKALHGFSP